MAQDLALDEQAPAVWVKQGRLAADLTQEALAARARCSVRMVQLIEAGKSRPGPELLARLARVFASDRAAERGRARGNWSGPFGAALRRYREGEGRTVREFAAQIGCDFGYLARIERGARPSKEFAASLAGLVGIAPAARPDWIRWARGLEPDSGEAEQRPSPATNLPAPPTALIGRTALLASVSEQLRASRLVTLTGPGGTGKTRLALQTGHDALLHFPAGVWFVDLVPIRDPAGVAAAIAAVLGVAEQPGRPIEAALARYLAERELLLILDNFEQVIAAAPLVARLLAGASGLRVLITSREALQLRGEREIAVPPLQLPASGIDWLELAAYEAVHLLVERLRDVRANFELTAANAAAVAAICTRLDGLPLALELAAARTRTLPLAEVAAQLDHRLALLNSGPRDLPDRHKTLRATISWSHEQLSPFERCVFRRAAVFAGRSTREALATVCADRESSGSGGQEESLLAVVALVEKNLLRLGQAGEEAEITMLELMHEYAREQLAASGEGAEFRQRHARYYCALAEQAADWLRGPDQLRWMSRLVAARDNMRVALGWALGPEGDAALALRMATALELYWREQGYFSEGRYWLEAALAGAGDVPLALRARALGVVGSIATHQADFTASRRANESSLTLWQQLGDRRGIAVALNKLANTDLYHGDVASAVPLFEQSLALQRLLGDPVEIALVTLNLGNVAEYKGDYDRSRQLYTESLAMQQQLGDRVRSGYCLHGLGIAAFRQGDSAAASDYYEQALALYRALGEHPGIAEVLNNIGELALAAGELAEAELRLADAQTVSAAINDRWNAATTLTYRGELALARGDVAEARTFYGESLAIERELDDGRGISRTLNHLALLELREENMAAVQPLVAESLKRCLLLGPGLEAQQALILSASLCAPEDAAPLLLAARAMLDDGRGRWVASWQAVYDRQNTAHDRASDPLAVRPGWEAALMLAHARLAGAGEDG